MVLNFKTLVNLEERGQRLEVQTPEAKAPTSQKNPKTASKSKAKSKAKPKASPKTKVVGKQVKATTYARAKAVPKGKAKAAPKKKTSPKKNADKGKKEEENEEKGSATWPFFSAWFQLSSHIKGLWAILDDIFRTPWPNKF